MNNKQNFLSKIKNTFPKPKNTICLIVFIIVFLLVIIYNLDFFNFTLFTGTSSKGIINNSFSTLRRLDYFGFNKFRFLSSSQDSLLIKAQYRFNPDKIPITSKKNVTKCLIDASSFKSLLKYIKSMRKHMRSNYLYNHHSANFSLFVDHKKLSDLNLNFLPSDYKKLGDYKKLEYFGDICMLTSEEKCFSTINKQKLRNYFINCKLLTNDYNIAYEGLELYKTCKFVLSKACENKWFLAENERKTFKILNEIPFHSYLNIEPEHIIKKSLQASHCFKPIIPEDFSSAVKFLFSRRKISFIFRLYELFSRHIVQNESIKYYKNIISESTLNDSKINEKFNKDMDYFIDKIYNYIEDVFNKNINDYFNNILPKYPSIKLLKREKIFCKLFSFNFFNESKDNTSIIKRGIEKKIPNKPIIKIDALSAIDNNDNIFSVDESSIPAISQISIRGYFHLGIGYGKRKIIDNSCIYIKDVDIKYQLK